MRDHDVEQGLHEVRSLFEKILGRPAPTVDSRNLVPLPPGTMPLEVAMQELGHLRQLATQLEFAPTPVTWLPRADCLVGPGAFVVQMEIPGIEREDLNIFVKGGECVVRGERKPVNGSSELHLLAAERPVGPFERRFPLPMGSVADHIKAVCRNGMLEIHVAVEQTEAPKEMRIDAA